MVVALGFEGAGVQCFVVWAWRGLVYDSMPPGKCVERILVAGGFIRW